MEGMPEARMRVPELQRQVNRLLQLYNQTIKTVHQDTQSPNTTEQLEIILSDIKHCRDAISSLLSDSPDGGAASQPALPADYNRTVSEASEYIRDGLSFIDTMIL